MERAPFEWSRPIERERERPRVQDRMPTGKPALGQPYVWATPKPRYVDDTPKMGRDGHRGLPRRFLCCSRLAQCG